MLLKMAYGLGLFLALLRFQTDTSPPPLEVHFPEPEHLDVYLDAYLAHLWGQEPGNFYYPSTGEDQWFYWDLNGDSALDLVIFNPSGNMFILLWQGDHYAEPFHLLHMGEYIAGAEIYFEDWTADGTPEVIFDLYDSPGHGTGILQLDWKRSVIHCNATACSEAWGWRYNALSRDYNNHGLSLLDSHIQRYQNVEGVPQIDQFTSAFALGCDSFDVSYPPLAETRRFIHTEWEGRNCATPEEKGLRVSPVYRNTYMWNGAVFEQIASVRLSEPYLIKAKQQFNAENNQGDILSVFFQYNYQSQKCYLTINRYVTWNSPFECLEQFTSVDWVDVFGNGEPVIMVNTVVPDYDIACVLAHRLLLYTTTGYTLFDDTACIFTPEIYPIHLRDMDGDRVLEIIAPATSLLECTQKRIHNNTHFCDFQAVMRQKPTYYKLMDIPTDVPVYVPFQP